MRGSGLVYPTNSTDSRISKFAGNKVCCRRDVRSETNFLLRPRHEVVGDVVTAGEQKSRDTVCLKGTSRKLRVARTLDPRRS